MRKLWILAVKEVKLAFRDVGAILTMLVTPLGLTLAIAAAFGTGGDAPLTDIPVLLLNLDEGALSESILSVFESEEVSELIALEVVEDEEAARARVNADEVAALIVIPADFSETASPGLVAVEEGLGLDLAAMSEEEVAALPEETLATIGALFAVASEVEVEPAVIEVYASPDWRISTSVVKSVVTQGVEMMNIQMQGMMTVMERIVRGQLEAGGEMDSLEGELALSGDGVGWEGPNVEELPVQLEVVSPTGRGFNWLDYSATSMAILFLMFAVTSGGRTLLAEREGGTLPRLLVSPTPPLTVLLGKMAGVALTGVLQVAILWGATTLLLDAYWGHPLAAAVSIVMLVLSATGVGAVISAWSTSPVQAGTIGTAFTLVGAATAGTFVPRSLLPEWLQQISLVTPQAWAIEIFSRLQTGRTLVSILPLLGGLFLLTVLYYVVALLGFRRQFQ